MGRILGLVLSFLSCLLVLCLAGRSGRLVREQNQTVFTVAPAQTTSPTEEAAELTFPAQIPGIDLVIENLVCYEGPFLEDGSDTPVSQIMALVLSNTGDEEILCATVQLEGERDTMSFQAEYILPGMSVMVLETNMAPYTRQSFTSCWGSAETVPYDPSVMDSLRIEEADMGTLQVTNIGNRPLPALTLYHKNYLSEGIFVGGRAYRTSVESLEPGETVYIHPDHYAAGYSRVFKAGTQ